VSVLLRRARAADVPAIARLESACFTHPWSEAQVAEEVAGAGPGGVRTVLVLEGPPGAGDPGAQIRAYASFRLVLDEMHVLNVAVAPEQRRRGLARWLLAFSMRKAARAGACRALLEVRAGNAEALALYESLGFRRAGMRRAYYRDPPEDALLLSRDDLAAFGRREAPAEP
jgi:ribosomal-protein-alanine N-acetyltransferase